mgnify:FL=1
MIIPNYSNGFQKIRMQHGKVLGGGSSVNLMVYIRGHQEDYDSWEKLGCDGWGWKNVEKYFQKMENHHNPASMLLLFFHFW